jgi:3-hydroxyacyl-CoA dehydrogenase
MPEFGFWLKSEPGESATLTSVGDGVGASVVGAGVVGATVAAGLAVALTVGATVLCADVSTARPPRTSSELAARRLEKLLRLPPEEEERAIARVFG